MQAHTDSEPVSQTLTHARDKQKDADTQADTIRHIYRLQTHALERPHVVVGFY